ncbi:hypothetical protein [Streptomyces sp. 2A115]
MQFPGRVSDGVATRVIVVPGVLVAVPGVLVAVAGFLAFALQAGSDTAY